MRNLGHILFVLTVGLIIAGVIYSRRKRLNWESHSSLVTSVLIAYSAVTFGLAIWLYTMADASEAKLTLQQTLLDSLAIDLRRGKDACLGHMDISKKLLPGQGRVIGLVPQIQLEELLRSDIPMSAKTRYSAALMVEQATLANALLLPTNPTRFSRKTQGELHVMCVLLNNNRETFEKRLADSLAGTDLQYRPADPANELGKYPWDD